MIQFDGTAYFSDGLVQLNHQLVYLDDDCKLDFANPVFRLSYLDSDGSFYQNLTFLWGLFFNQLS